VLQLATKNARAYGENIASVSVRLVSIKWMLGFGLLFGFLAFVSSYSDGLIVAPAKIATAAISRRIFNQWPPTCARYWTYFAAGGLIAAGFTSFTLISFHFQVAGTVAEGIIPLLFAVAMATAALTALVFGRLLDRVGYVAVLVAFALSALFAPFVFLGGLNLTLAGMILWGIGTGA
jgi:hypothetical protein